MPAGLITIILPFVIFILLLLLLLLLLLIFQVSKMLGLKVFDKTSVTCVASEIYLSI